MPARIVHRWPSTIGGSTLLRAEGGDVNHEAWRQLEWEAEGSEYERVWDEFDSRFHFEPSARAETWPSIKEPTPSVTYDLSAVLTGGNLARAEVAFGEVLLRGLQVATPSGEPVYALDWQHAGYEFTPALETPPSGLWDWPVPALPNGDYYIFVARDLNWGVFGHPWERTWCVFGTPIVEMLTAPAQFEVEVVRRNGTPTGSP